jgi:two-component system, cell cycle sensor histidine kinase and response regulator CckA
VLNQATYSTIASSRCVAHDFNNILTAISGYTEFALRNLEKPNPDIELLREEIAGIRQAGERAAELTRQLLAYSRRQVLQRRVIDLNDVVESSARMLRRLIGEHITVELVTNPDIPPLEADAAQLEQVILNLALNARDAMPNGGTLTIRTAHRPLTHDEAAPYGLSAGSYLSLSVQDTGVGISQEARAQIFEPFFTTKSVGEGTGLGLATAYGIAQQSGGTIGLESELGVGSTFHVYLPATTGTATPVQLTQRHVNHGTERILLVEDDEILRDIISEMLSSKGYDAHPRSRASPGSSRRRRSRSRE